MDFRGVLCAWVTLAALVPLAGVAPAIDGEHPAPQQFTASASMVLLDVSVTARDGEPLRGLDAEDFVVIEDGVEQPVTFFQPSTEAGLLPASVILLLDRSSSIGRSQLEGSRRAARAFVEHVPAGTELAVASFDDQFHLAADFTRDRERLKAVLLDLPGGGGTAMYDAVVEAVRVLRAGAEHRRQFIVLWSDGADLDSQTTLDALEGSLEASTATLYAVGQYDERSRSLFMTGERYFKRPAFQENLNPVWVLERLAELTGGRAFFPPRRADAARLLERIARAGERHYVIGFQPPETDSAEAEAPRFRTIEVRIRDGEAARRVAEVRTRRGYVR